jgi:tetratricopeptide (TPR) repeat protein
MPKSKPPRKKKEAARGPGPAKRRAAPALPPLPDRRAMEAHLAVLTGRRRESALDAAQDLMYDAWDAAGKRARVALARKALAISPLCADAYVLLAQETSRSVPEALDLYRKGVEAGELALGKETFEQDVGHFWGLLETRPYMRARSGLAQALWASGERDDAIGHYRDMLRLNPNDNQGVRYLLAACLQAMERHTDLDALLEEYDDGSAIWAYTQALGSFRREGDTKRSRSLLGVAAASNGHVPGYLLGERKLPRTRPDYITMGGEDEAIEYVRDFGAGWESTPGAVVWLHGTWPLLPKPGRRGRH